MLKNLHLHYLGYRRTVLERELAQLRLRVECEPAGMRQDHLYVQIARLVNEINPVRLALGLGYISAYA